jgi:phenylalanyl-tRNA synthetase beta chain
MQFSEAWLRSMVDPALGTEALAHLLTMSGLEVEDCVAVAPPFTGVVVAEVLSAEQHPNADRLRVCEVDAGGTERLRVVCGAPNVAAGMKVPFARIGAVLPPQDGKPVAIGRATMRGVASEGMLCSARELGLSEDHSGLLSLPADARPGSDVRAVLGLDDRVFTIKLTPNRADCLGMLGIAREVAALTNAPLRMERPTPVTAVIDDVHAVGISDPAGCGRFTGRVLRDVDAGAPTPDWMKHRLERAGQRSISALVDVTNYVMLELGRPLHVYDLEKLRGPIDVRFGRKGERLQLLNGQTVDLDEDILAITDDSGPIGLAGIMGGESTKADLDTRHVLLEAAFFFPDAIAGRSRRYNFSSDASHRFERGVDFDNNLDGIERATQLILEICGGKPGPVDDVVARLPVRKAVTMRVARARRIIGVPVSGDEMADVFARLGLPAKREAEQFVVTPPSFRFDIEIEEDLIEEVARVYGFDRIPSRPPVAPAAMLDASEIRRPLHAVRDALALLDYHEVINYSFVDADWERDLGGNADPVRVLNPIASQMSVMRSQLAGGLLANVRHNVNRKHARVRVFEVGRVFRKSANAPEGPLEVAGIEQPTRVGGAAFGPALDEQWGVATRAVDFYDVKGDIEALLAPRQCRFEPCGHPALHPGRAARILVDGTAVGWLGELHPAWQQKYELPAPVLLFEIEANALQEVRLPVYAPVSRFPAVRRDLAVVVDDGVPAGAMVEALRAALPGSVESVEAFDLYRGKGIENGRKSLAFRVLLQDTQKTLTDAEVDETMALALSILQQRFGGNLRQ